MKKTRLLSLFRLGHLASFCETSGEDDESVDSILKARRAAVSEYYCDALLTGSYESGKFVDLDAYCEEEEILRCASCIIL